MLNENVKMTRPGGIALRTTWKDYAYPKRMRSPGIDGEELKGQQANPDSPGGLV